MGQADDERGDLQRGRARAEKASWKLSKLASGEQRTDSWLEIGKRGLERKCASSGAETTNLALLKKRNTKECLNVTRIRLTGNREPLDSLKEAIWPKSSLAAQL